MEETGIKTIRPHTTLGLKEMLQKKDLPILGESMETMGCYFKYINSKTVRRFLHI